MNQYQPLKIQQEEAIEVAEKSEVIVKEQYQDAQLVCSNEKIKKSSELNPYLIFHSPDQSDKSPFKKKKKIKKLVKSQMRSLEYEGVSKIFENFRAQNFQEKLCFTKKQIVPDGKLGMLLTLRIGEYRTNNLFYSSAARSVINIPKCMRCNRLFKNHSGLGGHMRICKKTEESNS